MSKELRIVLDEMSSKNSASQCCADKTVLLDVASHVTSSSSILTSVTRLGDLYDFGPFLKAFGSN